MSSRTTGPAVTVTVFPERPCSVISRAPGLIAVIFAWIVIAADSGTTFDMVGFCCAVAVWGSTIGSVAAAHIIPATATDFRRTILIVILHFVQSLERTYHSVPARPFLRLNAHSQR